MIAALVRFSLTQRLMLLILAAALAGGGIWSFKTLPIDAFPDISSPQVQIIIKAPGLSPTEVESRITFPVEMQMQGLPKQKILRSVTKSSLSIIKIDFEDGTDIYWARNQVTERLNQVWASLPQGIDGGLAPITTPLGEIFMYRIQGEGYINSELRSLQDWTIRPRLRTVDGVADVNSLGGEVRAFEINPNLKALIRYGLSIQDIQHALEQNNRSAGGDRIERNNTMLLLRTVGLLRNADDIRRITVGVRNGVPILLDTVADVHIGSLTRYGAVTADGEGEVVTGLVLLRKGANSRTTIEGIKQELEALKSSLPKGISLVPFYDRSDLVSEAVMTVEKALAEAVILVLLVLIVMLGNLRAALTVAIILPLSVLFTFIMMRLTGISANLMTLGGLAIAIGILVDAAVVVVENVYERLSHAPKGVSKLHIVYRATTEVATPVISGVLIIIVVFLPLFSLTGLEGKMFMPLAATISFALIGSLILSLTVIPVVASLVMRGGSEDDGWLMGTLKKVYRPVVNAALRFRLIAVAVSVAMLVGSLSLFPYIGKEFMPIMDEGSTVILMEKSSDVSLKHSLALDAPMQKAFMEIPEVVSVVSRTGADELRMDPMGLYQTDNFIITKPKDEWTIDQATLLEKLREKMKQFKDVDYAFSQPIDMRVSEMLTGVRSAMAIKLYGDDLQTLERLSEEIETIVSNVDGAIDIFRGKLSGQTYLQIDILSEAIAKYGLHVEDINMLIETAVAGQVVSEIIEDNRRTSVLLRYAAKDRTSTKDIQHLLVTTPRGAKVPLHVLANIHEVDGPVEITRESARRQVVIQANVEGRDVVSFVKDIQAKIDSKVDFPTGYYVTFGGQFENQQRAAERLSMVVPIAIVLIYLMLFVTFGSLRQAGLIIMNIPFAMIGGVVSLYLSGLYLSVPASVGFITLFGVAVLNGVVMVTFFNQLRENGRTVLEAVKEGAERRLRPVLMTAMIASLGLVPLLFATGPGSELQQPLAVVVIGGLVSSTLLTLILLPTLYAWLEEKNEHKIQQSADKLQKDLV
ncbi:MAG: CusA/CzcA family heavy metal efflux RND transporter [Ghiorsea sp.]|nr:CusA/CzcA family heavy metal efflux RND transporter [Ghiorsea sp.]